MTDRQGRIGMPSSARDDFGVVDIQPEWVLEPEALGSKRKFWYRHANNERDWLFKYSQPNTGQHWAEKLAAEIASHLGVLHARVELATFQGHLGSTTESFARGGRSLFHGNQLLAGNVHGYDPKVRFRQADHTLGNIFGALDFASTGAASARQAKVRFAQYLVLDALIGNTDRHHENWGLLQRRVGNSWRGFLAPSFDHASSLGRELLDTGSGKTRERLLTENLVASYAESGRGGIYWSAQDRRAVSPVELVRRAAGQYPEYVLPALDRLSKISLDGLEALVARVPADWMTPIARKFALALLCYNVQELRKLLP